MSRRTSEVTAKQIERGLSPVIIKELQKEYQDKENREQNVSYTRDTQNKQKISVVNPTQLQYQNNSAEDQQFLSRLDSIISEYTVLKSQFDSATKFKLRRKRLLLERVTEFETNLRKLSGTWKGKVPIMKLHKDYQSTLDKYKRDLQDINFKLTLLTKSNLFNQNKIKRDIKMAVELLSAHDSVILAWIKLEPRDIILNSGEVIIEKIVEAQPSEEKIRELISKNIHEFIPEQKSPEPIIKTQTQVKTVYVPAEPDHLGKAYHLLYGQKNYAEALTILRDLDQKNDAEAQCMLGVIYLEGIGARKDVKKASEYLNKAASANNPEALYRLACLLEKGKIRESSERGKDIEKAVDYYKRAAIEGELNALTDLAYLLENGKYVNKDVKEAYKLLKIAADRHFPRALNNLGIMLFNHLIQDKDGDRKAFEYFQRAADQGYAKAFTNLGICYEKGRGISKSIHKALEYYQLGSELFDVDGIFHVAFYTMQEAGKDDNQIKYLEAADLFREVVSKEPEYADAHYYLGFLFENGFGVEQDPRTAFRYYEKAANLNHPKGWVKLGTLYATGSGIPIDEESATIAYEKAAKFDDTEALNLLGAIYEEGRFSHPDYEKAYDCYEKASMLGDAKAKLNLGAMYEKGRYVDKNPERAKRYYQEAADLGNVQAQLLLTSTDVKKESSESSDDEEERRDELETSLAKDLDPRFVEAGMYSKRGRAQGFDRYLEKFGIPTTSTIPSNQYLNTGSNNQVRQGTERGTERTSLFSENNLDRSHRSHASNDKEQSNLYEKQGYYVE